MRTIGKYQLDQKGKAAVTKFHEKLKPVTGSKSDKVAALRANHLKKKQKESK